ncbi:CDP-glucose 4,6-dehydratase [Herbaspirillum sp. RTI4]|uniref:CDP-glucose 4,6-dehydratase n=1 Tax=Herbaspirillum sp. RTI4 TaxID=3048640 RepID=UPI002AB56D1A|nr:CDP-glucose 4,6-dehydratase [Herbaspirillum sp. RTI4]MDY7577040.1 CDP-glucose 4,6-dehydratase [Herbaspirillum sp. RTI4]MEA9982220.1 CDP-glucose 4,6-dehydratase [Herbaspirillum sp. RTI4]
MIQEFWQGKKVFITGHTGFMGSWLTLWLNRLGAEVHGYSLPAPTQPSMFHLARLQNCATTTTGDIGDLQYLRDILAAAKPDIVFHLAAQAIALDSYAAPIETFATNVMGTAHLLEAVRHTPSVRSVVIVSSDKCYENREWVWGYREEEKMGGHDPYSGSKGAAEIVTASYRSSFFGPNSSSQTAIATARAGNVIGGGDFATDRLIPDLIRALEKNQPIMIHNPHAIRPWQFVLDPLAGYMQLAQRLYESGRKYAEGWNFGPADSDLQTVSQLCAAFNHSLQKNECQTAEIILAAPAEAPHETSFLRLDISKSRQHLDWMPKLELHTALELTAQWYSAYLNNEDLRELSEQQIDFFQGFG